MICGVCAEEIADEARTCPYCEEPTRPACPHCARDLPPLTRECPAFGRGTGDPVAPGPEEAAAIRDRTSRNLARAWCAGVFGLGLQIAAVNRPLAYSYWGAVAFLGDLALFVLALRWFARSKGRAFPWGVLGLLSCVEWIVVFCLQRSCAHCRARVLGALRCAAPV